MYTIKLLLISIECIFLGLGMAFIGIISENLFGRFIIGKKKPYYFLIYLFFLVIDTTLVVGICGSLLYHTGLYFSSVKLSQLTKQLLPYIGITGMFIGVFIRRKIAGTKQ